MNLPEEVCRRLHAWGHREYHVLWEVDCIWARSPKEAAEKALKIHRDPDSMAKVFDVTDEHGDTTRVDLDE